MRSAAHRPGPLALALVATSALGLASSARADEGHTEVAIGMGVAGNHHASAPHAGLAAPVFEATVGVGRGLALGELHASGTGGSATDGAPGHLGFDLLLSIRPFGLAFHDRRSCFGHRLLRSIALDVGPSWEQVIWMGLAASRFGMTVGSHLDVPVTPMDWKDTFSVRLGVRRALVGDIQLKDQPARALSIEVYAAMLIAF